MCNKILISKIKNTGTTIELIPNRTVKKENLGDLCPYQLILGCGLECSESLPVVIAVDNCDKIPLLNKYGNVVYFNQIRRNRYAYCMGYGNNNNNYVNGQFVIFNNLCLPNPTKTAAVTTITKKEVVK